MIITIKHLEGILMAENTGNIGFEEDRDEYEAENIIWVPKEANSLPALKEKLVENFGHLLS
jgi:hypothetical protein